MEYLVLVPYFYFIRFGVYFVLIIKVDSIYWKAIEPWLIKNEGKIDAKFEIIQTKVSSVAMYLGNWGKDFVQDQAVRLLTRSELSLDTESSQADSTVEILDESDEENN